MEKRNVIESERTPRMNKQAEFDVTEKQAAELFEKEVKHVRSKSNTESESRLSR